MKPAMAEPPIAENLIDAALAAGQFKTFVKLVSAAGLDAKLKGAGPFTLFAPTDAAFAKFPDATLAKLQQPDQIELLRAVVSMHFAVGQVLSQRFLGKRIGANSVEGARLTINGADGLSVNGANLVLPDIRAGNGVLHGVDRVLWPQAASREPAQAPA